MTLQRQTIPEETLKATLKFHKSITEYFQYYDNIPIESKPIPFYDAPGFCGQRDTYMDLFNHIKDETQNIIQGNGNVSNEAWYGVPLLTSVDEALNRKRYLRMEDYEEVYQRLIKPRIQDIIKNSKASLELPVLKYNDLGLGVFDFGKASGGLMPLYKYYSLSKKEYVEGNEVKTYKEGKKYKYKLKKDNSPVVLVPKVLSNNKDVLQKAFEEVYDGQEVFKVLKKYNLKIGGTNAFTSTIKKCFLQKEKTKKLKNAIRLFVKMNAHAGIEFDSYKWNGYLAIGLEELLSLMGYAVNIVGIAGIKEGINYEGQNNLEWGCRFNAINLKRFDESLDKGSTLYALCDQSFFRVKMFDCMIREFQSYGDHFDDCLGYPANNSEIESIVFRKIGEKDRMWNNKGERENTPFLYYIIADVNSEQQLNEKILEIALDIVNRNGKTEITRKSKLCLKRK